MRKLLAAALVALAGTSVLASDGSYISTLSPLYESKAFHDSGKVFGIFMSCGSTGRPDCKTAFERLHTLTDYPACRDNFFIAIVDRSKFAVRNESPFLEPWIVFSIWADHGKNNLKVNPPIDQPIDCNVIIPVMLDEWSRYLAE